jgi:hypothetical protein
MRPPPGVAAGFQLRRPGSVSRVSKSGLAAKAARERLSAMPHDVADATNWRRDMPMRCYLFAYPKTCSHSLAGNFSSLAREARRNAISRGAARCWPIVAA